MKQNANPQKYSPRMSSAPVVIFATLLLLSTETAPTEGQQQRFFLPSANSGSFALPSAHFQEDADSAELVLPQRRLSSAESSSSSFFSSQPQLPLGTFTNSGPFSRQPTAQQFILNGQQAQFQPVRSAGSLSFSDAVSAIQQPSFFQQPPPSQRSQQQQPQSFNFFPGSSSQQQRFRPILQQQDSAEIVDDNLNSQSPLTAQQSSQERFPSETSRRPQQKSNGIISGVRNSSPVGSNGWWNPATFNGDPVAVNVNNNEQSAVEVSTKDATAEFNQQKQNQQQKRGRGQPLQGRRRPISTSAPSSAETLDEQEPAAIGFTVIHDANDNRSSWSQPTITTHRPQLGQTSFRTRTSPAVISGSIRRPTTYSPLSVASISSTSVRPVPVQSTTSTATVNRQQPTTYRTRKPSLVSAATTTVSTYEDQLELEQQSDEDKQLPLRKSTTTTLPSSVPVTTSRNQIKPRLNTPVASIPQQQQRMKKVVNNPAIIQSITTRKPIMTSTSTLAPTTTTIKEEEYEEYEDIEYTTSASTTSDQSSNKKQTKPSPVTQSPVKTINHKNNSLSTTTESWVVVASIQTSRSVSSSLGSGTNQNLTTQNATTSPATTPTNKHRFNNKPTTVTTSTTTVESIIDKLDRVQSELSNGILYGSASNHNNSSRILTDIQNSGNSDDKRNYLIMSSFTTPTTQKKAEPKITSTTPTTTTTSTTSKTSPKEDDENEEEEKEEDDSDDSNKETTFVRKFVPSKLRTSTVSNIVSTTTIKPSTQTGKKKSLIDSVKFDELLTSGLLPAGFNPKPPPAYKSKIISTTTTTETSQPVTNISVSSDRDIEVSTTPNSSTTTVKVKSGFKIKFADDSSALASLLPPGFKLEESIKPVETLPPSLLPPGYKIPTENDSKNKEQEEVSTTAVPSTEASITTAKATVSSTAGIVFPNSGKGTNSTGTRKPLPSSKKIQASVTVAPVIQKGWPVRATTEFTGWSTPSTTPLSIEKLLSQSKASDLAAAMTSTLEPTTSTTTTTTTMKPLPITTPGQCSESDSVCELVGTVRIVGSGSEKWIPELLDHNTAEWRLLANEVESQLDKVYSKSPALSKWYKKITIDSFSPGNNGISTGKPDKNAGILVDFFVQLNQLGRTVSTADIRRLFHETLQKEGSLGSSAQPLQYGYGGDSDGLYLKLGRFTVDPARTDFIVLPKPTRGVTVTTGTEDAWLPQWAVAVMVIGLASLLFVLIFGITVLVSRHRNNKKIPPPTIQTMVSGDHHKHVYGTGKNGPTVGGRHHPLNHPNSNYNVSSYGYDNYAIDDDMMMLEDDDLEDVDRLYDMDAVWADDKHKAAPSSSAKKHRDTHYDSWRSTALSPQPLAPAQIGYYPAGVGGYSYGADPGYGGAERRHYHREPSSATNPRSSHHHYSSSHHNPNSSYTATSPRKPPQQYHPDYDTDF